jgi:hypothetical protein
MSTWGKSIRKILDVYITMSVRLVSLESEVLTAQSEQCSSLRRTIFHHPHPHRKEVRDDLRKCLAEFDAGKIRRTSSKVIFITMTLPLAEYVPAQGGRKTIMVPGRTNNSASKTPLCTDAVAQAEVRPRTRLLARQSSLAGKRACWRYRRSGVDLY